MVSSAGAVLLGSVTSKALDLQWQQKAWRFYGAPDNTAAAGLRSNQGAIGEVRFVMGWIAQQIGRVEWHVEIDGRRLQDDEAKVLMDRVANSESTIIVATNMIVAGELNYCAMTMDKLERLNGDPKWEALAGPSMPGDDEAKWMAVSVVDNHRDDLLKEADLNLRAIWPHPAKPTVADPPMRAVIDVLEEIEQLQDLAFSQNRSRIAQMGILTVANEFDLASPSGDFGTDLERTINAPIADPRKSSAAPILLRGPFELMTGSLSNGARGVQWTRPVNDFDERLDDKMKFLIQRLAWGFPVAPEILMGMTATNRAVAFQIEESTYRSHVEPIAKLVGRVYAGALKMILEGENQKVEVIPDPTELLARRHSVADAKDAYDRGLVRAQWVRRVLGIDEEDAATDEDIARIILLRKGTNAQQGREPDPSEVSGNEPVRASGEVQSESLADALAGALSIAHASVVSRVGAAARTRIGRQQLTPELEIDPDLANNRRLPSLLGPDRLTELDVDIARAVQPTTEWISEWWELRLGAEEVRPEENQIRDSCTVLADAFETWSASAVTAWPIARVPNALVQLVVDSALSVVQSTNEHGGG